MTFRIKARGSGDLKTRYRPQRLSEVIPTFHLKEAKAILENPNASQVYLFEGLSGNGKTSLARIIARASLCTGESKDKPCLECDPCKAMNNSPDFTEINIARFRGIDDIRDLTNGMGLYPSFLSRRIYIFDEAHQLTPHAQELLNKVLEEPIGDTLIFLCTTHKKGLKRTLLGRCAKINFRRMSRSQMDQVVAQVCLDNGRADPEQNVMDDMFMRSDGSIRDLMQLLEKVLLGTYTIGSDFSEETLHEGSPDIFKLVNAYKAKDWNTIRQILNTDNVKNDPDGYRETVCAFLARDALKSGVIPHNIAFALGQLAGSLWNEPKREQHNTLVLRSMRACFKKRPTT